jgi:hypothetical protein
MRNRLRWHGLTEERKRAFRIRRVRASMSTVHECLYTPQAARSENNNKSGSELNYETSLVPRTSRSVKWPFKTSSKRTAVRENIPSP